MTRRMAGALCSAALVLLAASPSWSAELLMFRRAGCPYCLTWDRVVGPAYPKSDLGGRLPLRTIDLDRDLIPEAKLDRPVRFTPTFVRVDDGCEVGRIEGYPGEDFFGGLLERLVRSRPSAVQSNYDMDKAASPRRGVIG